MHCAREARGTDTHSRAHKHTGTHVTSHLCFFASSCYTRWCRWRVCSDRLCLCLLPQQWGSAPKCGSGEAMMAVFLAFSVWLSVRVCVRASYYPKRSARISPHLCIHTPPPLPVLLKCLAYRSSNDRTPLFLSPPADLFWPFFLYTKFLSSQLSLSLRADDCQDSVLRSRENSCYPLSFLCTGAVAEDLPPRLSTFSLCFLFLCFSSSL